MCAQEYAMYITIYCHWTYTLNNDFFMQLSWDPDLHMAIKSGMVKRGVLLSVCTVDIYFQKTTTNRKYKTFQTLHGELRKIFRSSCIHTAIKYRSTGTIPVYNTYNNHRIIAVQLHSDIYATPWKICTSICSFTYHDRKWIT